MKTPRLPKKPLNDADRPKVDIPADKVARDTARYEALAREHGADLSEEGFNEALRKLERAKQL